MKNKIQRKKLRSSVISLLKNSKTVKQCEICEFLQTHNPKNNTLLTLCFLNKNICR